MNTWTQPLIEWMAMCKTKSTTIQLEVCVFFHQPTIDVMKIFKYDEDWITFSVKSISFFWKRKKNIYIAILWRIHVMRFIMFGCSMINGMMRVVESRSKQNALLMISPSESFVFFFHFVAKVKIIKLHIDICKWASAMHWGRLSVWLYLLRYNVVKRRKRLNIISITMEKNHSIWWQHQTSLSFK